MKFKCRQCQKVHSLYDRNMILPVECSCGNRFLMCNGDFHCSQCCQPIHRTDPTPTRQRICEAAKPVMDMDKLSASSSGIPVARPAPVTQIVRYYKYIYHAAVKANGGKDLTEQQFLELLQLLRK